MLRRHAWRVRFMRSCRSVREVRAKRPRTVRTSQNDSVRFAPPTRVVEDDNGAE